MYSILLEDKDPETDEVIRDPFTDEIKIIEINNYKYWGSYKQGLIKEADKTTELCSNRFTYLVVTAITDYVYDIDITLKSK